MYEHYRTLISLRRRHPWLTDGQIEVLHKENEKLRYRVTSAGVPNSVGDGAADADDERDSVDVVVDLAQPSITATFSDGTEFSYEGRGGSDA